MDRLSNVAKLRLQEIVNISSDDYYDDNVVEDDEKKKKNMMVNNNTSSSSSPSSQTTSHMSRLWNEYILGGEGDATLLLTSDATTTNKLCDGVPMRIMICSFWNNKSISVGYASLCVRG